MRIPDVQLHTPLKMEKGSMDYHRRQPQKADTPTGRDCRFCRDADPGFDGRRFADKLVRSTLDDTASAHITEDGYVKHRMLEITKRSARSNSPSSSAA
jgi:hypothetical protein